MTYSGIREHLIFPVNRTVLHGRDSSYWWRFARGRSLGYHRGLTVTSWFARVRLKEGRYHQTRLGEADDDLLADGKQVLSFDQAFDKAERWCEEYYEKIIPRYMSYEHGPIYPKLPLSPPYTVAHAMVDYMQWYRENRKGFSTIYYVCRASIFPKLGDIPLDQLTTRTVREWLDALAESPARIRVRFGERPHYRIKSKDPDALRRRRNTANRILTILKASLNRAYEYGYVDSDLA